MWPAPQKCGAVSAVLTCSGQPAWCRPASDPAGEGLMALYAEGLRGALRAVSWRWLVHWLREQHVPHALCHCVGQPGAQGSRALVACAPFTGRSLHHQADQRARPWGWAGASGRGRCEGETTRGPPPHICWAYGACAAARGRRAHGTGSQGQRHSSSQSWGPLTFARQPGISISTLSFHGENQGPVHLPVCEGAAPHHQCGQSCRASAASGERERQGEVGEACSPARV